MATTIYTMTNDDVDGGSTAYPTLKAALAERKAWAEHDPYQMEGEITRIVVVSGSPRDVLTRVYNRQQFAVTQEIVKRAIGVADEFEYLRKRKSRADYVMGDE